MREKMGFFAPISRISGVGSENYKPIAGKPHEEFYMKNKKMLVLGIVLVLMVVAIGVAYAGYMGPCKKCDCERFTYSGEMSMGSKLCICGHRYIAHEYIDD
jgi:hypothetical protein